MPIPLCDAANQLTLSGRLSRAQHMRHFVPRGKIPYFYSAACHFKGWVLCARNSHSSLAIGLQAIFRVEIRIWR